MSRFQEFRLQHGGQFNGEHKFTHGAAEVDEAVAVGKVDLPEKVVERGAQPVVFDDVVEGGGRHHKAVGHGQHGALAHLGKA